MNERGVSLFLELLLKPGLAFGLAAVVSMFLQQRSAALRHRVWGAAFLVALSIPLLRVVVPPLRVQLLAAASGPAGPRPAAVVTKGVPRVAENSRLAGGDEAVQTDWRSPRASTLDWPAYIGLAWALGAIAFSVRLVAAYWRARRIAKRAWRPDAERLRSREAKFRPTAAFARRPELRLSRDIATPIVLGILRPLVILPDSAAQWSDTDLDAALTHEMAHIERRDMAFALAAQVACVAYWCNPLAWIAAGGLAREAERACDDRVVNAGAEVTTYAGLLLELAVAARIDAPLPKAATAMARPSEVETRLLAILDPRTRRDPPARWLSTLLACGAVALASGAAAVKVEAAARPGVHVPAVVRPTSRAQQSPRLTPDTRSDSVATPASERLQNGPSDARVTRALEAALSGPDSALAAVLRTGLMRRSSSPADLVRERSAWALAQERNGELVSPLLDALASRDWRVQAYAAWALSYARSDRVDARLAPLLGHQVWRVRAMAASALRGAHNRDAQQGFERALRDDAWQVRAAAVEHFGALRDPGMIERLRPLLADRHIAVRTAAADALGSR